ncbi:hypothetical protein BJX70DRAFT_241287 [Aspergillus crustosus]
MVGLRRRNLFPRRGSMCSVGLGRISGKINGWSFVFLYYLVSICCWFLSSLVCGLVNYYLDSRHQPRLVHLGFRVWSGVSESLYQITKQKVPNCK